MKILIFPVLFAFLVLALYLFKKKKQKSGPVKTMWLIICIFIVFLIAFLGYKFIRSINPPDTQCSTRHIAKSPPQKSLLTAKDYFDQGNYDYDTGNCKQAIADYTRSIRLNQDYPEAYNNRAYTYMRMQNYKDALIDLNKALALNPNYIQALMNRGDIHNYYYSIDRKSAIADYEKVISLGATSKTSVCGHLFLARHNGWNLGTVLDFPNVILRSCN